MSESIKELLSIRTAIGRWSGLGPYYAMFPRDFAFEVVETYSNPGDTVIDPFAGRASSIYAAVAMERQAYGFEINPVGWLYGFVKLRPAPESNVLERIKNIGELSLSTQPQESSNLPEFFHFCYSSEVLRYLLTARRELRWEVDIVDATVMAIILVCLHGKRESSLSNQMRQSKAMSQEYSIRWWQKNKLEPPAVDPVEFLQNRAKWRYARGLPRLSHGEVYLGDTTSLIDRLVDRVNCRDLSKFSLLFTSPPYFAITNYHYDQWLRLWMLGGSDRPTWTGEKWKGKFESKIGYRELLTTVFIGCSKVMKEDAIVYVRTDARTFTKETTIDVLQNIFPNKTMKIIPRPLSKNTQTALYGDKSKKPGEIDIVMSS
jgi:DNA methylase